MLQVLVRVSLVDWIWCIMFCWKVFICDAIKLLYLEHLENALITKPTVSPVIFAQINIYLSVFISTFLGLIVSIKEATIRHFKNTIGVPSNCQYCSIFIDKLRRDIYSKHAFIESSFWNRVLLAMAMKWLSSWETGFIEVVCFVKISQQWICSNNQDFALSISKSKET